MFPLAFLGLTSTQILGVVVIVVIVLLVARVVGGRRRSRFPFRRR
jgi:hypothetical protein